MQEQEQQPRHSTCRIMDPSTLSWPCAENCTTREDRWKALPEVLLQSCRLAVLRCSRRPGAPVKSARSSKISAHHHFPSRPLDMDHPTPLYVPYVPDGTSSRRLLCCTAHRPIGPIQCSVEESDLKSSRRACRSLAQCMGLIP